MNSIWHLIDINHLFYRAYYGTPMLTNSKGEPTHALFGLLGILIPMLEKMGDGPVIACLDGANNFRKEIEPLYKSNRKEQPEDLLSQRVHLTPLLEALGLPVLQIEGYEADDLIGTLSRKAEVLGEQAVIISADKDFCQLVSDRTKIYDYTKGQVIDRLYVYQRYGITPEQFIDYLAIVGDSADCIVGVKGIGPKGASKLLGQYGNLQNIYNSVGMMKKSAMKDKLQNGFSSAKISRVLATIKKDVPITILHTDDMLRKPIKKEDLKQILVNLSFNSYLKELLGEDIGLLVGQSKL